MVAKPPPDTLNDRLLIVLLELCTPRIMFRTSFTCLSASLSGIGRLVVDLRFRYYCTYDIIALASLSFTNTSSNFGLSSSPCFLKNWFIALPVMSYLLMVQFLFCLILYSKSLATASSSSLEFADWAWIVARLLRDPFEGRPLLKDCCCLSCWSSISWSGLMTRSYIGSNLDWTILRISSIFNWEGLLDLASRIISLLTSTISSSGGEAFTNTGYA